MTKLGAAIVLIAVVAALLGPAASRFDPSAQDLARRLDGPSALHWFGLDELGRDIFSRVLAGARISLMVGIVVVSISSFVGTLLGSIAGYFGGAVDETISRVIDILLAFPGLLLAIALVAVLGPSLSNVVLALSLIGWVGYARLVRGQVLRAREFEFVQAARRSARRHPRILVKHIIPTALPAVTVQATLGMGGAILAEAALSFSVSAFSRRRQAGAPC
jgi:peptide/nickel transport system permease protein